MRSWNVTTSRFKGSYNDFHLQRINNLIHKKDTLMNPFSCEILNSSTWSAKDRLKWAIDSFAELELGEGFTFGDGSVTFRQAYFKGQISSLKDARMWLNVLKIELSVKCVQNDKEAKQ